MISRCKIGRRRKDHNRWVVWFLKVRWQQSTGPGVQATTWDWKLKETNCRVFIILATIMPADVCEINNHPSLVREIIEHILKARYQQKLKSGDGRHQYNENKLAPQSDWDKRGVSILFYQGFSTCHPLDKTEIVDKKKRWLEGGRKQSAFLFILSIFIYLDYNVGNECCNWRKWEAISVQQSISDIEIARL